MEVVHTHKEQSQYRLQLQLDDLLLLFMDSDSFWIYSDLPVLFYLGFELSDSSSPSAELVYSITLQTSLPFKITGLLKKKTRTKTPSTVLISIMQGWCNLEISSMFLTNVFLDQNGRQRLHLPIAYTSQIQIFGNLSY